MNWSSVAKDISTFFITGDLNFFVFSSRIIEGRVSEDYTNLSYRPGGTTAHLKGWPQSRPNYKKVIIFILSHPRTQGEPIL